MLTQLLSSTKNGNHNHLLLKWVHFSLLYPYGDDNEPFDMPKYLKFKVISALESSGSSSVTGNMMNDYKRILVEFCKRRPYTDNRLLELAGLFRKWLLRTATNVDDLCFQFLEKEQRQRIVGERQLEQRVLKDDGTFQPGKLYLPDSHVNSPAYGRSALLDVQSLVSRKPSSFSVYYCINDSRVERNW